MVRPHSKPVARRGDLSFECGAVVRIGNTTETTTCDFYADGPDAQQACRDHAEESGHPLHGIVGTACFFFPEA